MKWEEVKTETDLDIYLSQYCYVTCAHTIGSCGKTCCTPSDEEINSIINPKIKKLPLRKSFMLFLADFKANLTR